MNVRQLLMLFPCLFGAGCAHMQLARNVERQATTIADIQEQQVLNNIAMFCANHGSTPFFATPSGGGTGINRSATGMFGLNWNATTLTGVSAGGSGNQVNSRSWTLAPVNDPVKLGLMKAVYLRVTAAQCQNGDCNCHASDCKLRNYFSQDLSCHTPSNWFHVGDKAPRENNCCVKVGEYCGKYVWVEKKNFECLSQVTLAILDIATADSARLAKANGTPAKTVAIEQTFQRAGGESIKGTYTITAEAYKKLVQGANEPSEVARGFFAPEPNDLIMPQSQGGHLNQNDRLYDQLNLLQGSRLIP